MKVSSFLGTNTLSSKGCILSEEDNEHGTSFKMIGMDGTIQTTIGDKKLMIPVFGSPQL